MHCWWMAAVNAKLTQIQTFENFAMFKYFLTQFLFESIGVYL